MEPTEFSGSAIVKERPFDENPRRHFEEKRQALRDNLIDLLAKTGFLEETLVPTGKPNEYTMSFRIKAIK